MTRKSKQLHKLRLLTQYGVHIWAILLLANAALVYAFHFSTQAAQKQKTVMIAQSDTQPTSDPNQNDNITPLPKGPVIDLTFTIPGIGSGGGTMNPKRLTRNLTVFLYSIDANSLNNNVKPLYTIKSTATFETDTNSPLYTTYSNHQLDLGTNVQDGDYQLSFRTDESLRTLIKYNPDAIGGQKITLSKDSPVTLPIQTVLMGDTIPKEGDNTIDVSDYNAFINCFGSRSTSAFCKQSNYGDFDDNGVIDGIDYNILLRTFRDLLKNGQSIPQITPGPSIPLPIATKKPPSPAPTNARTHADGPSVTKAPVVTKTQPSSRGSVGGVLVSLFFMVLLIVGIFVAIKRKLFSKLLSVVHPSQADTPAPTETPVEADSTKPADSVEQPPAESTPEPTSESTTETPATEQNQAEDTTAIAQSTEIPVESLTKDTGEIEKSYYVKKKLADEAKTGYWLLLTDDNGSVEAHFTTKEVNDGFAKVKGVMKTENGKTFLEVSALTPEG